MRGSVVPVGLALFCTFAATVFCFGSEVFSAGFFYAGDAGRSQLVLLGRLLVLISLALLLVFKGGWSGVALSVVMVFAATFSEWLLLPVAFDWAASQAPPEVASKMPESVNRPAYFLWAAGDLLAVSLCAVIARAGRTLAGTFG